MKLLSFIIWLHTVIVLGIWFVYQNYYRNHYSPNLHVQIPKQKLFSLTFAKHALSIFHCGLEKTRDISVLTDMSSPEKIKTFTLLAKYFDLKNGVKIKIVAWWKIYCCEWISNRKWFSQNKLLNCMQITWILILEVKRRGENSVFCFQTAETYTVRAET